MRAKKFSLIIVAFAFLLLLIAALLHSQDFAYNENTLLLQYQLKKLKKNLHTDVETIIVGDSSAGNAIDASYFSQLSKSQTLNLALTGSYGLIGTYNMMQRALQEHKEIQNVLIMQSFDVWYRPLSLTSYFKTRVTPLSDMKAIIDNIYSQYLAYILNIKELNCFVKYLTKEPHYSIDTAHDFLKIKAATYANTKKKFRESNRLKEGVDGDKIAILKRIDALCGTKKLHCSYLHGPLHVSLVQKDSTIINSINKILTQSMKNIHFNPMPYAVAQRKLGDSNDHMDIAFKKESTKEIYERMKKEKN